jgi:2-oxo-4-hydroxy-4-carboxy-5-ureidoimidazoline decarboxylase
MIEPTPEELRAALAVDRWVADVLAAAPFADVDELQRVARDAATPLAPEEIDEAIAHHPRIGERAVGEGRAQEFSRSEQQASDAEDAELARALAVGNEEYEARFGRVFIIRAAGRTRAEIVDELQHRLKMDDETELETVGEQLRDIALLRLEAMFP